MLTKAQRVVVSFGAWAAVTLLTLLVFNVLGLELYFTVCVIGFLVIAQVNGPFISRPRWRARVNVVMLTGLIAFFLIVAMKVLDILGIRPF